jgi:hypothetical protein
MDDISKAKSMLPRMPEEVFRLWLESPIKSNGWPFSSIDAPISEKWKLIIGDNLSLRMLSSMTWSLTKAPFSKFLLNSSTKATLNIMLSSFIDDNGTLAEGLFPDSRNRFMYHVNSIKKTGTVCAPVVATTPLKGNRGYNVVDGYHRLCAISLFNDDDFVVDLWLAEA